MGFLGGYQEFGLWLICSRAWLFSKLRVHLRKFTGKLEFNAMGASFEIT